MGRKDTFPRSQKDYDQLKTMVYDAEVAEFLSTNDNKEFTGTAMELLQSIYRAESLPVKIRLYAATKAVDHEPKVVPQKEIDEQADEARDFLMKELDRLHREHTRQKDEQLHAWISEGKLTEEQALLARSQWAEERDAPWEPHKSVPPPRIRHGHNTAQNGKQHQHVANGPRIRSPLPQQPQPAPNGHAQQRVVVLYCEPYSVFWEAPSGREYRGGAPGLPADEIHVSEDQGADLAYLLKNGCRARR